MAFALAMGPCFACQRQFAFNPMRVPSIRINGEREPICEACMLRVNIKRENMGLPPHAIGAYEPCDEGELDSD